MINILIFFSKRWLSTEINSNFVKPKNGSVVQLVRIRACHARGRGFESRPDRKQKALFKSAFLFITLINAFTRDFNCGLME